MFLFYLPARFDDVIRVCRGMHDDSLGGLGLPRISPSHSPFLVPLSDYALSLRDDGGIRVLAVRFE